MLEGIRSIVWAESNGDGIFTESVNESLGKHLLIGLSYADLHLLQFKQLLEDFAFQLVPEHPAPKSNSQEAK